MSLAPAQSIELPTAAGLWTGRWGAGYLFYHPETSGGPNEARTQLLYDLAEVVTPLPAVRSLSFRTWEPPIPNPSGTIELEVRMSFSSHAPSDPDRVFANNTSAAPALVFAGTVNLPATTGGSWPQPWSVHVPLQTPFVWAPAAGDRALVVDVKCWNSTVGRQWIAELYDRDVGLATTEYQTQACLGPSGMPQFMWSVSSSELVAGGRLGLLLGMYATQHPSLSTNALCLGLQGVGGTWAGRRLPVPLTALGVPAPAGCDWAIDVLASAPMTYYPDEGILDNGAGFPLPADPQLIGLRLFVQNAALARYAAGLQVFPSTAIKLTIRSGALPAGSHVVAGGDRNATSGSPRRHLVIPIRLQ